MTDYILVKNNCAWDSDIDENGIDNGSWIQLSPDMTGEELIRTDFLIKIYKYHDADENQICYVFDDPTRSELGLIEFHHMFPSTNSRDLVFDKIVSKLSAVRW